MEKNKKQDHIWVNKIKSEKDVKAVSQKAEGNAEKDPFCVYGHQRHAVGSKIVSNDGPDSECTKESSWENR